MKVPDNLIIKHTSKLKSNMYNSYVDGFHVFFKDIEPCLLIYILTISRKIRETVTVVPFGKGHWRRVEREAYFSNIYRDKEIICNV